MGLQCRKNRHKGVEMHLVRKRSGVLEYFSKVESGSMESLIHLYL